jgi:hypothetical protein
MISFKIYSGDSLNRTQWDKLAERSLLARPDFVSVWQSPKVHPVFFTLTDGERILAGMPGVISGGRLMPRFESMIDGLGGGALAAEGDDSLVIRLYEEAREYFRSRRFFRASIHDPNPAIGLTGFTKSTRLTHIIDIADPDSKRDPKIDEHIRTGKRREARVTAFDDPARLDDFYDLVVQTARRHGAVPRYDSFVFERLFGLAETDERVIWVAVFHEDRLIASRISFVARSRIINWQSFSDKEFGYLKANYLMMEYIIDRARTLGINEIDLGGSPGDAGGLIDFKKRWGGRETVVESYTYYNLPGSLYYRWKNR